MPLWQRLLLAERGAALRYAAAVLLAAGALGLLRLLSLIEDGAQLQSVATLAVVLSAIYGGMGPALLAAAIAAVGVDYLFSEPTGELLASWSSVVRMLTYGAIGFLIASVVGLLRNAYRELHGQYRQTEAARRARESMMAIVSHDLRSPLSAVLLGIGYIRRAAGEGRSLKGMSGALDAVHRAADSMRRLVEDLLDAAKIESGRFSIEPARQPLLPILQDAVDVGALAADAKRMRVTLEVAAGEHALHCDRQRLTQVLANLIGNAVKFSPEGAQVEVRLADEGEWLRIDVRDWGPGIAREHLPHVFTRYWQASDTAQMGTGLGLFIAKNIVESHGGRIAVDSEPGRGSVFSVFLRKAGD
jgi:signal transduction histidine kinase